MWFFHKYSASELNMILAGFFSTRVFTIAANQKGAILGYVGTVLKRNKNVFISVAARDREEEILGEAPSLATQLRDIANKMTDDPEFKPNEILIPLICKDRDHWVTLQIVFDGSYNEMLRGNNKIVRCYLYDSELHLTEPLSEETQNLIEEKFLTGERLGWNIEYKAPQLCQQIDWFNCGPHTVKNIQDLALSGEVSSRMPTLRVKEREENAALLGRQNETPENKIGPNHGVYESLAQIKTPFYATHAGKLTLLFLLATAAALTLIFFPPAAPFIFTNAPFLAFASPLPLWQLGLAVGGALLTVGTVFVAGYDWCASKVSQYLAASKTTSSSVVDGGSVPYSALPDDRFKPEPVAQPDRQAGPGDFVLLASDDEAGRQSPAPR